MTENSHNLHKKDEDRIGQLSDDILISIISRLTIGEATATSILSTRWRYLHTYITHLHFSPSNFSSFQNYVNTVVDRVLDSHRGSRVKVLKVDTNKATLDKCFEFALAKEAEIVEIRNMNCGTCHDCFLRFASNLNIIRLLHAGPKCLRQLSLSNVPMNDQDFELLFSNCLALESVTIKCYNYKYLINVKIIGHPKLKHLDLSCAWELESIEIRDAKNLVSLKLFELRRGCALQLSNIPNFINLDYSECHDALTYILFARMPSCIRDQLQLLNLSIHPSQLMGYELPYIEFRNVKHLELVLNMRNYSSVYLGHPLIEACRSLEKLKIKLAWKEPPNDKMSNLTKGEASKIYNVLALNTYRFMHKKLSPKLKGVEIIGYLGSRSELELASYIINNAASLQELIVVTAFNLGREEYRIEFDRARQIEREIAHVLDSHRGSRVKLLKVKLHMYKASFHKCLEFALTKEAEIVDMKNSSSHGGCLFPLTSNLNIIRLLHAGVKSLKDLTLSNIHMNDQDFDLLVSSSLALESLSIKYLYESLENVKIIGHSKLKHLGLFRVRKLKSIGIHDVINLVSLKLCELPRDCALQLSNIPNFIKLDFREFLDGDLQKNDFFARMPSCIRDQLQLFHFSTSDHFQINNYELMFEFPNMKHLELTLNVITMDPNFVHIVHPWMEACHSLEKLKIKLPAWRWTRHKKREASNTYSRLLQKKLSPKLEVEIIGYLGSPDEVELASYIINNAASLQELTVVTALDSRWKRYHIEFDRVRRDLHGIVTPSEINILVI
ncbi:hypothetical protein C2S52_000291 [Perilla frutescens var. hirtella]|nr:hypothetical protein C2S52_000291 [Perilla frutescens var. hirtella]